MAFHCITVVGGSFDLQVMRDNTRTGVKILCNINVSSKKKNHKILGDNFFRETIKVKMTK